MEVIDISIAHRIGRPSTSQSSGIQGAKLQPVVVRFACCLTCNNIFRSRMQLKRKRISITEQLTPSTALLLKKASDLVISHHLESAWSHDGRIIVKTPTNQTLAVSNSADFCCF